jgi:hypothetical protein
MEIIFDVEIDEEDIETINKVVLFVTWCHLRNQASFP